MMKFLFKIQKYNFSYKVLFFGSNNDQISQIFLQGLIKQKSIDQINVITTSDRVKKNQSLQQICQQNQIQCKKPFDKDIKQNWLNLSKEIETYDLAFICSFGLMIPGYIIDKINKACIVVHPSLLPKYRGASPIQFTLLNDDKYAGVSFILTSKNKFDAGNILLQKQIEIKPNDRYFELSQSLIHLSCDNLPYLLENIDQLILKSQKQDNECLELAPKLDISISYIQFQKMDINRIYNIYRALFGTNFKSIRCKFNQEFIILNKIQKANIEQNYNLDQAYQKAKLGSIWTLMDKYKKQLFVKCQGGWLIINEINLSNGKQLKNHEFIQIFIKQEIIEQNKQSEGKYYFEDHI